MALSLGRITVQSALGEPLRAEIDVPDINAEEAASLKASIALPEALSAILPNKESTSAAAISTVVNWPAPSFMVRSWAASAAKNSDRNGSTL